MNTKTQCFQGIPKEWENNGTNKPQNTNFLA